MAHAYRACSIKRFRRTRADVDAIRAAIKEILKADHPQTVRQVFYQLVVREAIEKTENHGCLIPKAIEGRLREFCEKHDCPYPIVERIALTEEQIEQYRLPTRPTKREGNTHAKDFEGDSTELDAMPSRILRSLVRDCIETHITAHQLEILRAAEDSEREFIVQLADMAAEQDRRVQIRMARDRR